MPVGTEKVDANTVEVLGNTDCNSVIVMREFSNEEEFRGSMGNVMAIVCSLKEALIAEIKVDTQYFTGVAQAI